MTINSESEWWPKFIAAREQLKTAITLHFDDADHYSVHTLASNAAEVFESICDHMGVQPFREFAKSSGAVQTDSDFWDRRNLYRNTLKHAGQPDRELVLGLSEELNDHILYIAVHDYCRLRNGLPIPFQVYDSWFCCIHRDRLGPDVDQDKLEEVFPGLRGQDRKRQKRLGAEAIPEAQKSLDVMSHYKTEPLNLV